MKKKVAIVTLTGYFNYGNRLQNYALQASIEKLGFEVDTIVNTKTTQKSQEHLSSAKRNLFRRTLSFIAR